MKQLLTVYLTAMLFFITQSKLIYGDELTVVFTANTSGKLRACSCPNDPYGGLSERVTMIKRLRKEEKPFLLVDGGNMVSLYGAYDAKAASVMRLMNLMEYDAAGAGWQEIFHGIGSALKMEQEAKFPLLSATIAAKSDSSLVFKPYMLKKIGENTVGIISVSDSTGLINIVYTKAADYIFLPKTDILRSVLKEISSETDYIVILSLLRPEDNKKILKDFPEIDLIIEAYGNKRYDTPIVTPNCIIVSSGSRGKFVGLITLEKSKTGKISVKRHKLLPVLNFPEDKRAHDIIMDYYNNIN